MKEENNEIIYVGDENYRYALGIKGKIIKKERFMVFKIGNFSKRSVIV